jgi:hypothetical protein
MVEFSLVNFSLWDAFLRLFYSSMDDFFQIWMLPWDIHLWFHDLLIQWLNCISEFFLVIYIFITNFLVQLLNFSNVNASLGDAFLGLIFRFNGWIFISEFFLVKCIFMFHFLAQWLIFLIKCVVNLIFCINCMFMF